MISGSAKNMYTEPTKARRGEASGKHHKDSQGQSRKGTYLGDPRGSSRGKTVWVGRAG
ncbi:unnamed protein product [Ectocarpus sp. CCAP 1310/34]|nr:unnamed protein product [Ectocarpus sp. CCAP 1310/34]